MSWTEGRIARVASFISLNLSAMNPGPPAWALWFREVINEITGCLLIGGAGYRRWLPVVCCHFNTDVHLRISHKTFVMKFALPCKLLATQQPPCLKMLPCFAFQMQSWIIPPQFIWVTAWRWSNDYKRAVHHAVTSFAKLKIQSRDLQCGSSNFSYRFEVSLDKLCTWEYGMFITSFVLLVHPNINISWCFMGSVWTATFRSLHRCFMAFEPGSWLGRFKTVASYHCHAERLTINPSLMNSWRDRCHALKFSSRTSLFWTFFVINLDVFYHEV